MGWCYRGLLVCALLLFSQPGFSKNVFKNEVIYEALHTLVETRTWIAKDMLHIRANAGRYDIEDIALIGPDGKRIEAQFFKQEEKSRVTFGFGFGFGTHSHHGRSTIGVGSSVGVATTIGKPKTRVHALFTIPPRNAGVWYASVKLVKQPATVIPLGKVKRKPLDSCHRLFGYQKEIWTAPDGSTAATVARIRSDGRRVAGLHKDAGLKVLPMLDKLCASLPVSTAALQKCPEVSQTLAGILEGGVHYQGRPAGGNSSHYSKAKQFWLAPQSSEASPAAARVEDVPDTLLLLLFEANQASTSDDWRRLESDSKTMTQQEFVRHAAEHHANNLYQAIRLLKTNRRCLKLKKQTKKGQGKQYTKVLNWLKKSKGDIKKIARFMLDDSGQSLVRLSGSAGPYRAQLQHRYSDLTKAGP
jgi:hypothetical protein